MALSTTAVVMRRVGVGTGAATSNSNRKSFKDAPQNPRLDPGLSAAKDGDESFPCSSFILIRINAEIVIVWVEFRAGTVAKISEIAAGHADVTIHHLHNF